MLDEILRTLIEGDRLPEWEHERAATLMAQLQSEATGRATIERIQKMIARNEYKRRQAPPVLRVRGRAFGSGRQVPIAAVQYA